MKKFNLTKYYFLCRFFDKLMGIAKIPVALAAME